VLNFDSPYYHLHNKSHNYHDLHTFRYVCFDLPPHERHKLSAQSAKCVFFGYSVSHKGFGCYDMSCNKFHISRNVVFFENQYFFPANVESSFVAPMLPHFEDVHLLRGSNLELFMKDVNQLCPLLRLIHHLILLLRLLLGLLLMSLLFAALREYLILLLGIVFLLLYPLLIFHHVTHTLYIISVGKKQCRTNFMLFRIIIHGILFLVLLLLPQLSVNRCTRLSFALKELSIDIKHVWLLLEIDKRMVLTMRKLLLL